MGTSCGQLEQDLKKIIDWTANHDVRKTVLISYEAYRALAEKAYQLSSPANHHKVAFITAHNYNGKAVLMSDEDYRSLKEMAYQLRSPANVQYLRQAFSDFKNNKKHFQKRALIEE